MFNLSARNDLALATGNVSIPPWLVTVGSGCGVGAAWAVGAAQAVSRSAENAQAKMTVSHDLGDRPLFRVELFVFIFPLSFQYQSYLRLTLLSLVCFYEGLKKI
jgi:hypothetical protein